MPVGVFQPFLSITLEVAVEGETEGEFVEGDVFTNVSLSICGGQNHLHNWHHYKDEQSHAFQIARHTGRRRRWQNKLAPRCVLGAWDCVVLLLYILNNRLFPVRRKF